MSEHLSSRQIDEAIIGTASLETQRHLRECARCQAEVARVQEPLASFRHSVRAWTGEQLPARAPMQWDAKPAPAWTPFSRLSLAIVAVALCLLVALSWSWSRKREAVGQSVSDAALLSQIDAEVSRSVPAPMEPLTEFVAHKEAR